MSVRRQPVPPDSLGFEARIFGVSHLALPASSSRMRRVNDSAARLRGRSLSIPVLVFALMCLVPAARSMAQPKVMCIGDSITEGVRGWASYRYPLWFDLISAGLTVDFVGPWTGYHLSPGSPDVNGFYPRYTIDFDRDHAGYSGWRTDEVASVVTGLATNAQPDIVLIHLGTNDIGQQLADGVNNADVNLRLIISRLRAVRPNVIILLASIIPRASNQPSAPFVEPLNARIATIASDLNTPQSPIHLVDQHSGFDLNSMMQDDGLHPNTAGEQRMADVWRSTLMTVLGAEAPCPAVSAAPPANSLIALYTFDDGSMRDVTTSDNKVCRGLGNPLVVNGGYEGRGLLLDGASYIRSDVLIHPAIRPQLTMGAWVWLATSASGTTLFSHDNGGWDRTLAVDDRGGGLGWSAFTGSGVLGFVPAPTGQWSFVAVVYDSSTQQVTLYVDGQVRQSIGNPMGGACGQNLFVGKEPFCNGSACSGPPNASCTLNGIIDNAFVMSEALTVGRLDEIMIGGYHRIPTCATVFRHPECVSSCAGGAAGMSVDAGGAGVVSYQWRKNLIPIGIGDNPSAATAVLVLSNVQSPDAGLYDCVVSNACGSVVSNAAALSVCRADANCDNTVNSTDISAFLTAWLDSVQNGNLVADFNSDNQVNSTDISAFLTAWLAAVQGGC